MQAKTRYEKININRGKENPKRKSSTGGKNSSLS